MVGDRFLAELGIALQAQNHLIQELQLSVSELDASLTNSAEQLSIVSETSQHIKQLEALLDEIEADQEWLEEEDFDDFNPEPILSLYKNRRQSVFRELTIIGFKDWHSFVGDSSDRLLTTVAKIDSSPVILT